MKILGANTEEEFRRKIWKQKDAAGASGTEHYNMVWAHGERTLTKGILKLRIIGPEEGRPKSR